MNRNAVAGIGIALGFGLLFRLLDRLVGRPSGAKQ